MDFFVDFLLNFYGPTPYLIVLGVLLLCGLGLPIPEDVTLFAGGVMAYYGICDVWLMIGISLFGVLAGDAIIFLLGSHYGLRLTKKWFFARILPPDRLEQVSQQFRERGNKILFFGRFMPGLRAPIFFSAGTLGIPFRTFLAYDGLAAVLSVPAIVYSIYFFGDELDRVIRIIKSLEYGIVLVVAIVVAVILFKWVSSKKKSKLGMEAGRGE